jgi:hypothetical protein
VTAEAAAPRPRRSAPRPGPRPWPRLRRRLRNALAGIDPLYLALARAARPDHALRPGTRLVAEGYPRSANSWFEACCRQAWGEDLGIAQHLHAAAPLRAAARRGLPAALLLRAPVPAAASLTLRQPEVHDGRLALAEYVAFHARLLPVADRLLVVPFEAATRDFPACAAALTARFGLDWPAPDWGPEAEAGARARLDALTRARVGRAHVSYSEARPAAERAARAARAEAARAALAADPRLAGLRARAEALHARLLAGAPPELRALAGAPG